jgi:hypothetical protein
MSFPILRRAMPLMNFDFTLQKYAQFCKTLKQLPCRVMTVRQFLEAGQPQDFIIVLRHDVDRSLSNAMKMAKMEARYGIGASYYVRMTQGVFQPSKIRVLSRLGHEVGYHYEVMSRAKGDMALATTFFKEELKKLRQIVPVHTICMHGSPLSPWNNLDLWQTQDCKDYDLAGEVYLSVDYSELYYFTDTGRSWDSGRYNLRDRVDSKRPFQRVHSTDELIVFLRESGDCPIFINLHPNRWSSNLFDYFISMLMDQLANQVKWIISTIQKRTN